MKIFIAGGPKTGKTTLADLLSKEFDLPVVHTDEYRHLGWSQQSTAVALRMCDSTPVIIEGVTVARALRKWLLQVPNREPCDRLMVLYEPLGSQSKGQQSLARGVDTVLLEIMPELLRRGVVVIR